MWAVLPLKDFARSKQRLAGLLDEAQRSDLVQAMASDVLRVLSRHPEVAGILVVSGDPAARRLAQRCGAETVTEAELGAKGLNPVVQAAVASLAQRGIEDAMVLHGDLPLITAAEISRLIAAHRTAPYPALTLATDRHGDGSNGLLCATALAPTFGYGPGSCRWHQEQARQAGMACQVLQLRGIGHDIDTPDDLAAFLDHPHSVTAASTRRYLAVNGIARQLLAQEHA